LAFWAAKKKTTTTDIRQLFLREDPVTLHDDRAGELDERRQPAAPRPLQPTVEQSLGGRGRELVNLAQLLLEQVGAVEPGVGALDLSELGGLAVPTRPG
jgi:hypothetical protein